MASVDLFQYHSQEKQEKKVYVGRDAPSNYIRSRETTLVLTSPKIKKSLLLELPAPQAMKSDCVAEKVVAAPVPRIRSSFFWFLDSVSLVSFSIIMYAFFLSLSGLAANQMQVAFPALVALVCFSIVFAIALKVRVSASSFRSR